MRGRYPATGVQEEQLTAHTGIEWSAWKGGLNQILMILQNYVRYSKVIMTGLITAEENRVELLRE